MIEILQHLPSKSSLNCHFHANICYLIDLYGYLSRKFSLLQGCDTMSYLERIERNIRKSFPDITEEELHIRMELIKHLIAMEHQKNNAKGKNYEGEVYDESITEIRKSTAFTL